VVIAALIGLAALAAWKCGGHSGHSKPSDVECGPDGCKVVEPKEPAKPVSGPSAPSDDGQDQATDRKRPKKVARLQQADLKSLLIEGPIPGEDPCVDLPQTMRTKNYSGGSCVHASTINLLIWQGLPELAQWWRDNHGGGEYSDRLNAKMDKAGLKFAYTTRGDMGFLEWTIRTRRGAGIGYFPRHAINLVDLTETEATLLDNNRTGVYIKVPRAEFERKWRGWGGWAWTVVYQPPPPLPWRAEETEGAAGEKQEGEEAEAREPEGQKAESRTPESRKLEVLAGAAGGSE
jgi:hypothetical protein